jgi:formylmethanofuran dehydrogenase subunit E
LGLRAGLIALRELRSRQGDPELRVEVELPYRVPISCLLDGIQFSTGCTIGNKRLTFKESTDITLTFAKQETTVELTLKTDSRELLHPLFDDQHLGQETLHELAHNLACLNEDRLFSISNGSATR